MRNREASLLAALQTQISVKGEQTSLPHAVIASFLSLLARASTTSSATLTAAAPGALGGVEG